MKRREPAEVDLLIVGASVRAAAQSAVRAGYRPCAVDLFCDEDLLACCPALQCSEYPAGLAEAAAQFPEAPWLYTGALENYPEIIDCMASARPLLGNSSRVVDGVRDPETLARCLRGAGLHAPDCTRSPDNLPYDGSWLRKPLRSAGGAKIQQWKGQDNGESTNWCFQQRIDGLPCSAIYVAAAGSAVLLGVTQQIIGADWAGAKNFQYAGSIGPLAVAGLLRNQFEEIGQVLSRDFCMSGLFGVDAIIDDREVWPVEVNPRYTASVEVLERALNIQAVRMHVEACQYGRLPVSNNEARSFAGKAILYAKEALVIPESFASFVRVSNGRDTWPTVADIPAVGSKIPAGRPVVTLLHSANSADEAEAKLRELAQAVERLLYNDKGAQFGAVGY